MSPRRPARNATDASPDVDRPIPPDNVIEVARGEPWWRLPVLVVVVGIVVFGALAVTCRAVANQTEQGLLEKQTKQAAAALNLSIGQIQAPLVGAARAAVATDGDPDVFTAIVTPLLAPSGSFASFALFDAAAASPIATVGRQPQLAADPAALQQMLADAQVQPKPPADPFVVVDLLDHDRTLGFATSQPAGAGRFVVYAERALSPDPNVRRRRDDAFSQVEYALYLGDHEAPDKLLGASVRDLPIDGRRATAVVPYGNRQILLVTTPIGRLGSDLLADLWWIVAIAGVIATAVTVMLLQRLRRSRARAVALAEENARKHREQRDIAETLQRELLPQRLTPPPDTAIAARYWPAGSASLIGGDFYDAFRIDERRWGVAIGDVCGKGIEAAGLTGMIRHTIRTAARSEESPAAVLRAVHEAMAEHQPATFCTVCFLVYTPDDGGRDDVVGTVTIALGGHPQPLLRRGEQVGPIGSPGTLLGMIEPKLADVDLDVGGGDIIVMFTDGLTDAPGDEAVPLDELSAVVRGASDVEVLADEIGRRKRGRRPAGSDDDTAVLVIRFAATSTATAPEGGATTRDVAPVSG